MPSLDQLFAAASPRLSPRPTPIVSRLITWATALLWIALFSQAFVQHGIFAWSTGLAYILYDTALLCFTGWQTLPLLGQSADSAPPATRPSLGVVIAAHNEAPVIEATIGALLRQGDPPDQILLADDGSTDATASVMAALYRLAPPPPGAVSEASPVAPALRWLRVRHGGKARALNAGIPLVESDIVLTVDADTLLEPGAIAAMRRAFADEPALVAATGVLTPVCGRGLSGRFFEWFQTYEYIRNFLSRAAWERLDSLLLISGAFAAFRRDALVAVGGFDAECLVEDYELIHRLHRRSVDQGLGWRVRVVGAARARTDAPGTLAAFLRQRRRWFAGFLQTQRWNRDMVGNRRFGHLGTAMLPVKSIDTLQPIYGLTAFALLIFFIATGRFHIAAPILAAILIKIVIDLAFHLWSLHLYRHWTGGIGRTRITMAILAALAEPFSFQLMRHAGAAWGWLHFLSGREVWGRQSRAGIRARGATG